MLLSILKNYSVEKKVKNGFYSYGLFASKYPWSMITFSGFIILFFSYPLLSAPLPGSESSVFYSHESSVDQDSFDENISIPNWYENSDTAAYIQQLVIKSTVQPWPGDESNQVEAFRTAIESVFVLLEVVKKFKFNGSSIFENCYPVNENLNKGLKFLFPKENCLVASPALFWEGNQTKFQNDKDVKKTLKRYAGNALHRTSYEDLLFGMPSKWNGVKKFSSKDSSHMISYAVTLVLKNYDAAIIKAFKEYVSLQYGSPLLSSNVQRCWKKEENEVCKETSELTTHIHFKSQFKISDATILIAWYACLGFYILFSVQKINFLKSKSGMACSAITSIVFSLMVSVGLCILLGLTPTSIRSEWYPFLGGLYNLENILVLTKSVVANSAQNDIEERVAYGLGREGYSILTHLLEDCCMVACGYWMGSPIIREFFCFFGVAILSVTLLQMVFFVPVLSIDIRRRIDYVEDHSYQPTVAGDDFNKFGLINLEKYIKTAHFLELGGSQILKFPKRLKVLFFAAEYRIVKRVVLVVFLAWHWCFDATGTVVTNYKPPILRKHEISAPEMKTVSPDLFSDIKFGASDLISAESLHFRHWPTFFNFFANVSLDSQYISILPPLLVPITNKLDLNKIKSPELEKLEKTYEQIKPLDFDPNDYNKYGVETRLQYYLTLLSGAIAGMLFLLVIKFLYSCICSRDYANWKYKRMKRSFSHEQYSSAGGGCVPLALAGHSHSIELVSVDGMSVASSDLSGEIRVWDSHSGECICTMARKFKQISPSNHLLRNGMSIKQHQRKRSLDSSIFHTKQRPSIWTLLIKERLVFAGCENGSIEVWDSVTGKLKGLHDVRKAGVAHLACEGTRFVCARINGTLDFFDVAVTELASDSSLQYRGHNRPRLANDIGPASQQHLSNLCESESLQLVLKHTVKSAHQQPITCLAVAQNRAFTASCDHTLKMFNLTSAACEKHLFGHSGAVTVLHVDTLHPFGAVSGADDGAVLVWNLQTGGFVHKLCEHRGPVSAVCGTQWNVISAATDDCMCVWSRRTGALLRTLPLEQGCSGALCLLGNNWFVSGSSGKILLWDVRTRKVTRTLKMGSGALSLPCVTHLFSLGNLSVLCVVGRELFVARLPFMLEKSD